MPHATPTELWQRLKKTRGVAAGIALDTSRVDFRPGFFDDMASASRRALKAMADLEKGSIANPDEERMVGHYWLRRPELAPTPQIRAEIEGTYAKLKTFAADVRQGRIQPQRAPRFSSFLLVGIGGSALGPQFVSEALGGGAEEDLRATFLDNTDPDGMDRILRQDLDLHSTLTIVVSKSGSTKETRNGMVETMSAYRDAGLDFSRHAVAVTGTGSELDELAQAESWLERFAMWDWVGGRTSEFSAVGLLPTLLEGVDADRLLRGAKEMDAATRSETIPSDQIPGNLALRLALAWHHAGGGRGAKDMVVIPYKDRLSLLSRYLQQLVMESLGKERDVDGRVVHQGLAVYGNKGSTDQHSYVQQLRDGVDNFFVTFIQVLRNRRGTSQEVEPGVTSGDYLLGFLLGTREALYEKGRQSITIALEDVTPEAIGALIALYERAVGIYASLVNINAYHQPGVEAGKKAAGRLLALQNEVVAALKAQGGKALSAEEVASAVAQPDKVEAIFQLLEHLVANSRGVRRHGGDSPHEARYDVHA